MYPEHLTIHNTQVIMWSVAVAARLLALLALPAHVFSSAISSPHGLVARADPGCPSVPQTSGGRKIAIVIDSSGSNTYTDPNNLRIAAAKDFNGQLLTQAQAGSSGQADQVTVVDFDYSATVIYPLGDPSGADAAIDTIDSDGGTYIASGIGAAIDELTANTADPTAGRTGIVVLTDGEDSSLDELVAEINRAQGLGIRVAFGFLSPTPPTGAADLLAAILATGGIYSTIDSAEAQQNFVDLVLSHGPTDNDASGASGNTLLLPGLTVAGNVSSAESETFVYDAQAGEKLNYTLQTVNGGSLDVTLRDADAGQDLDTTSTDGLGHAEILFDVTSDTLLELIVSTSNATATLFTVSLNSSAPRNYSSTCRPSTNTTHGNTTHPTKYVYCSLF